MENHDRQVSIAAMDLAREKGIIIPTLPPHCSHKLQPLDHTVFVAFKRYCRAACTRWMLNHSGELITIYEVAELAGSAYPKAFTPEIIQSGFCVSGCYPFNRDIFTDDEFWGIFCY